MRRVVAFLRAINVGGHVVKMEVLRAVFEDLGFRNVETFIASGNVLFDTAAKDLGGLEVKIERALEKKLGYEVVTFIRTLEEAASVSRYEPFERKAMETARSLNVGFLKAPLDASTREALKRLKTDIDDFHTNGSELYWMCQLGQADSKISNVVFERTLKVRATFRGLNTMRKLVAKHHSR